MGNTEGLSDANRPRRIQGWQFLGLCWIKVSYVNCFNVI